MKTRIVYDFSLLTFSDFPNNIHSNVRKGFDSILKEMIDSIDDYLNNGNFVLPERSKQYDEFGELVEAYNWVLSSEGENSQSQSMTLEGKVFLTRKIDFNQQILEQNLVYISGVIESFMYDSVKLIYENNPDLIASHEKSLSFKEILEYDDLQNLKTKLIDLAVGREWAKGSFSSRIEKLRTKFKIQLSLKKDLQKFLDEIYLIRNSIVHNGSKVTKDYHDAFGEQRDIIIGDKLEISQVRLQALYYLSIDLIKLLFIQTTKQCWSNNELLLKNVQNIGSRVFYKETKLKNGNDFYNQLKAEKILL